MTGTIVLIVISWLLLLTTFLIGYGVGRASLTRSDPDE